jgi:hypothetical protein
MTATIKWVYFYLPLRLLDLLSFIPGSMMSTNNQMTILFAAIMLLLRPHGKITTGFRSRCINSNGIARRPHTTSMKASRFLLELCLHSQKLGIYFSVRP